MVRPFLSLVVAIVASVIGLALVWMGASSYAMSQGTMRPQLDVAGLAMMLIGLLFLAVVGLSLALHWVGALVVGAVHGMLGLLALVVPFGNPFDGGIFSPVFQITRMLYRVNNGLGDGATMFYFSGTAFAVGVFLAAAALGIRTRRLAAPASVTAIFVSSVLGGLVLLAASTLVVIAGGDFSRFIVQMFQYDLTLAVLTVGGGVLAGVAGILLRWSSIGVAVAAVLVVLVGFVFFLGVLPVATTALRLPAMYGLIAVAGVVFLGAALGGAIRQSPAYVTRPDVLNAPNPL